MLSLIHIYGRHTGQASAAEIEQLLSASQTKDYYSDRYACAYLTSGSGDTAVWYLNGEAALERARMAAFFGVDQLLSLIHIFPTCRRATGRRTPSVGLWTWACSRGRRPPASAWGLP